MNKLNILDAFCKLLISLCNYSNDYIRKRKLGSMETKAARRLIIIMFVTFLKQNNIVLHDPSQLKGKHIQKFGVYLASLNLTTNTKQNYMSHIRFVYRAIGKPSIASNPLYENEKFGFGGRNRKGTNTPLTEDELRKLVELANSNGRPAYGLALTLQLILGLRLQEVLFGKTDQLRLWIREIKNNGRINVVNGTKGGRPRSLLVKNIPRALAVLDEAYQVAKKQDGFLIVSKKIPRPTLEQAYSMYSRFWSNLNVKTHSARYAFAIESFKYYFDNGRFSEEFALGMTALELGHGFARYRLVKAVYCASLYVDGLLSASKAARKSVSRIADWEVDVALNQQEMAWGGVYQLSIKIINVDNCIC